MMVKNDDRPVVTNLFQLKITYDVIRERLDLPAQIH